MLYVIITCLVVLGDQFFKYWITANIEAGQTMPLLPGIVHLTYVENTGAAFSMFSGMRWILVGFTGVCLILMLFFMIKTKYGAAVRFPLALVMGGAVGNLIDRIMNGYVVDMFEVEFVRYAVFNIADAFINVGAILFVILYLIKSGIEDKREKQKRTARAKKMSDVVNSSMSPVSEMTAEDILHDIQTPGFGSVGEDPKA